MHLHFAAGTTLDIGGFNSSDQNPLLVDTCGTWLLFNNLFGVTPFVDFCKVTGNVCNEQGGVAALLSLALRPSVSGAKPASLLCPAHVKSVVQSQPQALIDMTGSHIRVVSCAVHDIRMTRFGRSMLEVSAVWAAPVP